LSSRGRPVAASTVKHRRQRWQAEGLPGLVDKRVQRRRSTAGRADPAVAEAMGQAIAEATDDSSRTASFIVWRTRQILAGRADGDRLHPAGRPCPARRRDPRPVELTGLIDVATRTVPAAVISPTAKSVDASVLLARALTPEPMRPGWPASLAPPGPTTAHREDVLLARHAVLPVRRQQAADAAVDQACRMLRLPTVRTQFPELAEAAASR
jgi:hypothetical protein